MTENSKRHEAKASGGQAGRRAGATGSIAAIKSVIRERISAGAYTFGTRLPSERQLCEEFGTARVTLHEILVQLETEGLIYREDRRGWFVSPARFLYNPQARGHFTQAATEQGREPSTQVVDTGLVVPPPRVRELLNLAADAKLNRIRRVRAINGRSVLYVEHYYLPHVFPGLLERDLSGSLTELYRDVYGFEYGRMKYQIIPTAISGEVASLLRVSNGSPALLVARVNHALDGSVSDCDLEYWRHDAVLVEVDVDQGTM